MTIAPIAVVDEGAICQITRSNAMAHNTAVYSNVAISDASATVKASVMRYCQKTASSASTRISK